MKFLVDEQLAPALARWLVARGHEAEHVYDVGLMGMSDAQVAQHAAATGAVVVTKDDDYRSFGVDAGPIQVLWIRLGNVSNRVLLKRLGEVWIDASASLEAGEDIVMVSPRD